VALSVVQAGSSLQLVNDTGVVGAPLTLPAGVTLRTDVPPRFFVYQHFVILVNTPSQPLTIDATGTVRLLSPRAPTFGPVLSGAAGGTLTGTYRVQYTFVTLDAFGNLISESAYSPVGGPVTITNQFLKASGLSISPDAITGRRLYRTTDNGAVYFQWVDLDGNVLTSVQDDLADAGLSLVAAPILGTPPRLTLISEFRGRLFGVGDIDIDHVRYTETGLKYSWPEENVLEIPSVGSDAFGVVALIQRREALGAARRNSLIQITGSGAEDVNGIPDFDVVILSKELGVESQETVRVFRDNAYFLWKDGVYRWNSEGITCISNGQGGKGNVRSWFNTNSYFNRDRFANAYAHLDYNAAKYRLFLSEPGSSVTTHWVEYNIDDGTWFGPSKTGLFTPSSAFNVQNDADRDFPVIGATDETIYFDQLTRTDGADTPIDMDAVGKRHDLGEPDQDKYFGQISVIGKAQPVNVLTYPSPGQLDVITRTGDLNSTTELTQEFDMTKSRQRLGRLGEGKHSQVELQNAEVGQDVEIYSYDIDPVYIIGRR
jgi:hypothetical protein